MKKHLIAAALAAPAALAGPAQADPIYYCYCATQSTQLIDMAPPPQFIFTVVPFYMQVFGPLPEATFGGTGIPNNHVAISQSSAGDVRMGLTATARFDNPTVTSTDGTFTASQGSDAAHGKPAYGRWNFDYYINSTNAGLSYVLSFDNDPATGTSKSTMGKLIISSGTGVFQDSWNLGMGFLQASGGSPEYQASLHVTFDPTVPGEYGFFLTAYDSAFLLDPAHLRAESAILVDVGVVPSAAVPEPGSLALVMAGLVGLSRFRRKS